MSNSFPLSWWIPSRFSCRTFPWALLLISRQLNWCCLKTTENGTYVFVMSLMSLGFLRLFMVTPWSHVVHSAEPSLQPPWNALECLGMPWNALECLGMTHSWLKIISGVQRTGDRWQRIELGETRCHEQLLCCKIWDSESLHWVHKSALLIIPAMQMSLMGSTTTRQLDVAAAC